MGTVYFTSDIEQYARVRDKLNRANIESKTKTANNKINGIGGTKDYYEVLVRANNVNLAYEAIYHD